MIDYKAEAEKIARKYYVRSDAAFIISEAPCANEIESLCRRVDEEAGGLFLECADFLEERQWEFDAYDEDNHCRECGWSKKKSNSRFLEHKEGCRVAELVRIAAAIRTRKEGQGVA